MTDRIVDEIIGVPVAKLRAFTDENLNRFQELFLKFDVVRRI